MPSTILNPLNIYEVKFTIIRHCFASLRAFLRSRLFVFTESLVKLSCLLLYLLELGVKFVQRFLAYWLNLVGKTPTLPHRLEPGGGPSPPGGWLALPLPLSPLGLFLQLHFSLGGLGREVGLVLG